MSEKTEGDDILPSVSVVIPVYIVEPFLRKCVDSVINQTLNDIEIILVDDGSTDSSGDICNEYRARDPRVRVIHKQNEGLSCAKNDGIDVSTAPYIMFVDGDDWVHKEFCERPYNAAKNKNADLVVFRGCVVKNGKQRKGKDRPVGLVDAETAVKYGGSVSWNKLYKRDLLKKFKFPKGGIVNKMRHPMKKRDRPGFCVNLQTEIG